MASDQRYLGGDFFAVGMPNRRADLRDWYTTHRNAAVYDLQLDAAVDLGVLIVIMLTVGGMISAGELRWFILVPTIGQIIDVYQRVCLGINNAAEKPYVPTKGST